MALNKISSAATTSMNDATAFSVTSAQAENYNEYTPNWLKWKGYYNALPDLQNVIDKKALWTVGKGFTLKEKKESVKDRIENIDGFGKDSFTTIIMNQIKCFTICGDSFCEIIGGRNFTNLKPLDPGTMKILGTDKGRLKGYEQWANNANKQKELVASFGKKEIFHMPWNRVGDAIHGTGTIEKLESTILLHNEAMRDMGIVFHRYVKPLIISEVDTDNESEILAFKTKLDTATANGENLIIPKGTLDKMQRISIPQYATLDPLPWIRLLNKKFIEAEGVPNVILGTSDGSTEATSKILYLAFQQMVEWNQLFTQENIKSQLHIDLKFKFPASIAPDLQAGNAKAKKTNNMEMGTKENTGTGG